MGIVLDVCGRLRFQGIQVRRRVVEGIVHAGVRASDQRVDEVFFVDLPNIVERTAIWNVHFAKRKRDASKFDVAELANKSDLFTGAEIEAALESAMFRAFAQDKEVGMSHIVTAISDTVPLAKTASEKIEKLRGWAKGRARLASSLVSESDGDRFGDIVN